MTRHRFHRRAARALSLLLVWSQVWPSAALASDVAAASAQSQAGSLPAGAPTGDPAAAAAGPPAVKVNRTVPKVSPAPSSPVFSAEPTDEELFRARVFGEPLVPSSPGSPGENPALVQALRAYLAGRVSEDFTPIERFLEEHPGSSWRVSLLTNLGLAYRRAGYFSRSLKALHEAWEAGKDEVEPRTKATAELALVEFLHLSMLFGRYQVLEAVLAEAEGRDVGGSAGEKLRWARQGLWLLKNEHHRAVPSGPTALDRILAYNNPNYTPHPKIEAFHPTFDGASLVQMSDLAKDAGMTIRMAFREGDARIPLPALVHLKVGHYSAIVREEGGSYLLHDPILGQEIWMSRRALQEEASGYFLIPGQRLPEGWRNVEATEASKIRGKCAPCTAQNPGGHRPCDEKTGGCSGGSCRGLAGYAFHLMLVNLTINDNPVGYSPPRGPSVQFDVTYNHRESFQPAVFSYSNLGPKWTMDWLSYVQDDPGNPNGQVNVYSRGGGYEVYSGFNGSSYAVQVDSRAVLVRTSTSPVRYERRLAGGGVEVFAQADGASTSPRRTFMTEQRDSQGQTLTFTYDGSLRLVAVTDATGQVTTLSYEHTDPLKVTKVTDPFGRFATLEYDASGRLKKITDVMGLASEFGYGTADFINSLTTPYGTSTFAQGVNGANIWAEATDPLGGKERVEYGWSLEMAGSEPAASVPTGFTAYNEQLNNFITMYWDKRAMMLHPGDFTKARVTRWLEDAAQNVVESTPHSVKNPLENRIWYAYPGQTLPLREGSHAQPSKVARVLDDGQTQLHQSEFNLAGATIREIDPVGRETVYVYGTNNTPDPDPPNGTGIDLLQTKQKNLASAGGWDILGSSTYDSQHQPLTTTDAAGQTTTYTYNAAGQPLTVVAPPHNGLTVAQRTTTYTYDPNGALQDVTGPASGTTTTYTYDSYDRVRTSTDPEGYTLTYDYDTFDRPTRTTYPDGTYEETQYEKLDAARRRDRLGRWSHSFHDGLRRLVGTRDAAGRTTSQQWCTCGSLESLVDANGNATRWEHDVQGRVLKEVRANGSFKTMVYETTTSRLKKKVDAKLQETHYAYALDDKLLSTTYVNAEHPTPNVTLSYTDPATANPDAYGRLRQTVDGTGTTAYVYHPVGQLGAGQLASVDGPYTNDTVSYGYDELGRLVTRTMNGVTTNWSYDLLGRLQSLTDPIGTFGYTYQGVTGRAETVTYPNGQTTAYSYFPNAGDHRLQEIHHRRPGGATLSKFNYTYDAVGNILTWTQQTDSDPAKVYDLEYDAADQLTAATFRMVTPPTVLKSYRYAYDPAGNRTVEQIDDAATLSRYDIMNRLTTQIPGGGLTFRGTLSEPATVTVGGKPATVTASNQFTGTAQVPPGTSQVTVQGTDPSGNVRTNVYEITQTGATTNFTYDPNGNLAEDGTKAYEWNANDKLIAVKQGGSTLASFSYDGDGRRTTKTAGGVTTSYVHDGAEFLEERTSVGATRRHVYGPGIDQPLAQVTSGTTSYELADHLGSIVRTTDSLGTPTVTREYDPWGNLLQGSTTGGYAFTGREWDVEIGLYYYRARYYDPRTGRFTSRDPLRAAPEGHGYAYASNAPSNASDPTGLYTLSGTNAERTKLEAAMKRLRDELNKTEETSYCCSAYFIDHGANLWQWITPGGRPGIVAVVSNQSWLAGVLPTPTDWIVINNKNQKMFRYGDCELGSLILHEMLHLARREKTKETEDQAGFRACQCGCINPRYQ